MEEDQEEVGLIHLLHLQEVVVGSLGILVLGIDCLRLGWEGEVEVGGMEVGEDQGGVERRRRVRVEPGVGVRVGTVRLSR